MSKRTETRFSHQALHGTTVAAGTLLLLWPALYNGYPMVNSDAGTYLASGFTVDTPFDRPITYGLLVRILSFNGCSLWPLIYIQALLIISLTTSIMRQVVCSGRYLQYTMAAVLILTVGTGLPWLVCQVQPDVLTPAALLCIIRIMMGVESKAVRLSLYILFFLSVSVHMSHPAIMAGTILLLYLLRKMFTATVNKAAIGRLVVLFLLSLGSIAFMGSALSKSKHVFIMGSLVEKGVLKQYLDDNCARKSLKICAYKDELPVTLNEFIWVNSSPLYKVGDWRGSKTEFNDIIHDIFTTPRYLGHFVAASTYATGRQLLAFGMGDGNTVFPGESVLSERIAAYLPADALRFQRSKQNRNELLPVFVVPDIVSRWVVALSMVLIAAYGWRAPGRVRIVIIVTLAGILLNAADTATFGCLQDRYGCRVMWLAPFCALAAIAGKQDDNGKPIF